MIALTLTLIAYLIGSISFAVIVSRAFALPDPRIVIVTDRRDLIVL